MAERITISLGGREFIATRAPFGVLRAIGKERNILELAFTDPEVKANFRKLREVAGFYEAAYTVIAAHLALVEEDGQEKQGKITVGEVQALCDSAMDEPAIQKEIFQTLTALQKLDFPDSFQKKTDPPEVQQE